MLCIFFSCIQPRERERKIQEITINSKYINASKKKIRIAFLMINRCVVYCFVWFKCGKMSHAVARYNNHFVYIHIIIFMKCFNYFDINHVSRLGNSLSLALLLCNGKFGTNPLFFALVISFQREDFFHVIKMAMLKANSEFFF